MATERKPVCFNIDDPLEREMWELAKAMNFSGWVKGLLRPMATERIAQKGVQKKGIGVPVPVRKAVIKANGTQAKILP